MTKSLPQVSAKEVAGMQKSGHGAMLVCAYDDQENFERIGISGSISFPVFQKKLGSLGKDQTIVFYCDCPHDELAIEKTAQFVEQGYDAKVLSGGVAAWQKAAA